MSVDGRSTPLGHADTQSWHPVQWRAMCWALNEPGGVSGVRRSGAILSSIFASPPSTFFFSCAMAAVVAMAVASRNERFDRSGVEDDGFSSALVSAFAVFCLAVPANGLCP